MQAIGRLDLPPEGTASKKVSGPRSRGRDLVALHLSLGTPKGSMAWCCRLPLVVSQLLIAYESHVT